MPSWIQPPSQEVNLEYLWEYILRDIWGYIISAISLDWNARDQYWHWLRWDLAQLWRSVEDFAVQCVKALDRAVTDNLSWLFGRIEDVREYLWELWSWMGPAIKHWGYTATSWAEAKRDEVWIWAQNRYEEARGQAAGAWDWVWSHGRATWDWIREKSAPVWNWISEKSAPVWNWISEKSAPVWNWIQGAGQTLKTWWDKRSAALDKWVDTYFLYYQNLFDNYRNELLDLLDDPVGYVFNQLVLSTVEQWIYGRWFAPME